jgi:8-oxo-dGTP diphosphatase
VVWRRPASRPTGGNGGRGGGGPGGGGPGGGREVALVHRPRYDDWSLPKGKLRRGEHPIPGACREVLEETALRPSVGPRLPTVSYPPRNGPAPDKVVDYWAMTVAADLGFRPGPETDELSWVPVDRALEMVSYARDAWVLNAFTRLPLTAPPVVVVRHASAGERERFTGPDDQRPLDAAGAGRARELAAILRWFSPTRLLSASPRRCRQTLAPLARMIDLDIEVEMAFNEDADLRAAAELLPGLATGSGCTVVCSQGKLIPPMLAEVADGSADLYPTAKGAAWVVSFPVPSPGPVKAPGRPRPAAVDPLP